MRHYKLVERLETGTLRQFCIDHEFYTAGDCAAYSNLFDMVRQFDGSAGALSMIALDIVKHSDPSILLNYTESGIRDEMILDMMNMIAEHCVTRWYVEVDT